MRLAAYAFARAVYSARNMMRIRLASELPGLRGCRTGATAAITGLRHGSVAWPADRHRADKETQWHTTSAVSAGVSAR